MGLFKSFVTENVSVRLPKASPEDDVEKEVQDHHFGVNDYSPFIKDKTLSEAVLKHPDNPKKLIFTGAESAKTGANGIVVPKHMWHGTKGTDKVKALKGMEELNKMRAEVYGNEHRPPLTIPQIAKTHKKLAEEHFAKPEKEQIADEKASIEKLKSAGHLGSGNTLDESEKTDTIRHEHDEQGRPYTAASAKGVAGHAVYTSGAGEHQQHHIINTCPGQTKGCGGGVDERGLLDTSKGTCFAPQAESQYPAASIRRATHEQAKHDPAMTGDWFKAHIHSLRKAAESADKKTSDAPNGRRFVFRPNVVDETDRSTRFAIKGLNKQRSAAGKPSIISYQYSKADELHDPENGVHVTHSNVGPKVKDGKTVSENAKRDKARIRQTITATDSDGEDRKNEDGKQTPPKNSYLVNNLHRGSDLEKQFQQHVNHIKYWSGGREHEDLSEKEKKEGSEGHFDKKGNPTTPDKAHYGHVTMNGRRYDYQKQHVLHPRMTNVNGHDIPSDSRFKDDDYLPEDKNRFKSKNGKNAGGVVVTSPTTSTKGDRIDTSFTHSVTPETVEHAKRTGGEWEIDSPHEQEKARGKEWAEAKPVSMPTTKKK